jgi:hypothetical protein
LQSHGQGVPNVLKFDTQHRRSPIDTQYLSISFGEPSYSSPHEGSATGMPSEGGCKLL